MQLEIASNEQHTHIHPNNSSNYGQIDFDSEIQVFTADPFFIQWLTEDHPSEDGTTVSKIEKIVIADKVQLSDSWFKTEILNGLDKVAIDWVDPSTQDGEIGIVSVHLSTPSGSVVLD